MHTELAAPALRVGLCSLALVSLAQAQDLGAPAPPSPFSWGDFDGDGLDDALVIDASGRARLLSNRGDGTLSDVSLEAGLEEGLTVRVAAWEDVDLDGHLDLFLGTASGSSRLLMNEGNGTFRPSGPEAGLSHAGEVLHAGFLDYDHDGLPDLHVRTQHQDVLYHNLGQGRFESVDTGLESKFDPTIGGAVIVSRNQVDETAAPETGAASSGSSPRRLNESIGRVAVPTEGPATPSVSGADAPARISLICARSLDDRGGGGCISASSTPTLGMLYPLSTDLFVDPSGNVGIGTVSPSARLEVDGNMKFSDDLDGIKFSNASGTTAPMITMFTSGSSNADRMVVAHSLASPDWGLEFRDVGNVFRFIGGGLPALQIDLDSKLTTAIDVNVAGSSLFAGNSLFGADVTVLGDLLATRIDANQVLDIVGNTSNKVRLVTPTPNSSSEVVFAEDLAAQVGMIVRYDGVANQMQVLGNSGGTDLGPHMNIHRNTGNVGIGTASPFGRLHVASTGTGLAGATVRSANTSTGNGVAFYGTTAGTDSTMVLGQSGTGSLLRGFVSGGLVFEVTNSGRCITTALQITGGGDLVEGFDADAPCEPGTVVSIDVTRPGALTTTLEAYDRRVAGVVSGAGGVSHGIRMGQDDVLDGDTLVAMAGRVWVKCSTENGVIVPGDRLTTADVAGHAMKATDTARSIGAVIGKAMSALDEGTGLVLVLVDLQ